FRLSYYGDYLPKTAHVKAEFDPASLPAGYQFDIDAMLAMHGLTAAMIIGTALLLRHRHTRTFTLVLLLPALSWLCYLTVIGGDHFPGLRLLHGEIVPMALLLGVGLHTIANRNLRVLLATVLALAAAIWN